MREKEGGAELTLDVEGRSASLGDARPAETAPGRRETHPGELVAAEYPVESACEFITGAGSTVCIRPIRPDDSARLLDFHQHLSPQSVYLRYFSVHPTLSPYEVQRFTCVDYVGRHAFIALDGTRIVAVSRFERIPATAEAEVAFLVSDEYQRQGLGTALLEHLAAAAWRRGITTFVATTLAENRNMLDVFFHSGFPVATSTEHGEISLRLAIEPA
jgi:GNAT superfamily N-acetyltransferase